jgi:hypothetical protein
MVRIILLNPRKPATPAQQRWNTGISKPTSEAERTESERIAACVDAKRTGPGWRHIAGPVYEHRNGTRVHVGGFVKLPNGDFLSDSKWPESKDAARMIRINGGNLRRGLMAWAMTYNAKFSGSTAGVSAGMTS